MDGSGTTSRWTEVPEINEALAYTAATLDACAVDADAVPVDLSWVRLTLLRLAGTSEKLTVLLDSLASHYDVPGRAEPPTMHVALDQAAAAAEDLAICARAAAEATDDVP
jgi:hypothetical protein